jgi:hypothetical protein
MTKLLLVLPLLSFTACSPAAAPTPSPAPIQAEATASPAVIDIDIRVADSDTGDSLIVDEVWLDGELAYSHVSRFVLFLDGDYPATQDGHETRLNPRSKVSIR